MVIRFGDYQELNVTDIREEKDSLTFTTNVLATPVSLPLQENTTRPMLW